MKPATSRRALLSLPVVIGLVCAVLAYFTSRETPVLTKTGAAVTGGLLCAIYGHFFMAAGFVCLLIQARNPCGRLMWSFALALLGGAVLYFFDHLPSPLFEKIGGKTFLLLGGIFGFVVGQIVGATDREKSSLL